ncbi:MAG: hypothetical protein BWY90_00147 [Deltaproteobacteria bacterium ADurb.BinA014]|jgi:hypothetical protein|nr:MAG: hypothetical protein BWY90_00147 [Deltaproteobacteria bacterium ADurb.BinA014]
MNLQEFVTQTIIAIVNGVADAKAKLGEDRVNPIVEAFDRKHNAANSVRLMDKKGNLMRNVTFDVAVTASQATGTKGSLGIIVAGVGLGTKGQTDKSNATVSRVQFTVPVTLP